jgi:hypothetical protein
MIVFLDFVYLIKLWIGGFNCRLNPELGTKINRIDDFFE